MSVVSSFLQTIGIIQDLLLIVQTTMIQLTSTIQAHLAWERQLDPPH